MKLPNGFGSVYRLQGTRRRPYVIKKTIDGKQKIIGYADSYEHGISFLVDFNRDPALFSSAITFKDLYFQWKTQKFPKLSKSSCKGYEISYMHCQRLHNMVFANIRFGHLQSVIDDVRSTAGYSTQKKCRVLMEQLYSYAAKYDIVTRDYAKFVEIDTHVRKYKKRPFTVRERNRLWRNTDFPGVQDVLILIYSGLRIGEYMNLQRTDVKLRRHIFIVRQSKTEAGRMRPVPIYKNIYDWFSERHNQLYICQHEDGSKHTYESFRRLFDTVMEQFNMHHTPHECRHTLASMLDTAGANDTAVKMILGHARQGVTKHDYTHKTIRDLRKAIDSI